MAHSTTPAMEDTIVVELSTIGGEVKKVRLNGDRTVRAALVAGGFPATAEVRVNGQVYKGDDEMDNGDEATVLAGERVKGGSNL